MFRQPVTLDRRQHAALRLRQLPHYQHAAAEWLVPVMAAECWHIAREYVLLFACQDDALPLALLGVEPGRNAHVGEQPPWWGRYVPAHIRRYPFLLGSTTGAQQVLCIDAAAPHLDRLQGEPLFDAEGQPTPLLTRISGMLAAMQRDEQHTRQQVLQIAAAGLLRASELRLGAAARALSGFRVVDTGRLQQLPATTLAALQHSGALALVYAHLGSLSNLQDGLLARRLDASLAPADPWTEVAALFERRDDDNVQFKF